MWHGVARVGRQIHNDLLNLSLIGSHPPNLGPQAAAYNNVLADQPLQLLSRLHNDFVQIQYVGLKDLLAAVGKQLAGQAGGTVPRLGNLSHQLLALIAERGVTFQELAAAEDNRHQIVEVVGDAAGQLPYRLQLLRLGQFSFQSYPISNLLL